MCSLSAKGSTWIHLQIKETVNSSLAKGSAGWLLPLPLSDNVHLWSIIKHCSLKKPFLSLLAILRNSAFNWIYLSLFPLLFTSLHFSTICKASSDNHFAFLLFFFFGMVLFTASCTILWTSIYSSSGTLLTRSSPLNLFLTSTANSYGIWFKSYLTGLVFFPVLLV